MWKNNTIYTCCKSFPSTFTSTNNKIINIHKGAGRSVRYSTHRSRTKYIIVEDTLGNIINSLYRKSQILNNFLQLAMSPTPVSGTLEASNNVNQESLESVEAKKMKIETFKGDKENQNPPLAVLRFVKMTEFAHNPTRGSKFAAGYDLKSAYKATVPARGSFMVKTDIQIQLPSGTYGRVAPRSGLALKYKIDVGAGVIDEDYRGNVGVILFNHSDEDFQIAEGDRIAQLICEKIVYPEAVEVESLDESERGGSGFGSTGTNN